MHPVVVSVENLPPEGKTVPLQYARGEVEALFAERDVRGTHAAGGVQGDATVMPSGRDVFVLGALRSRVGYECVRCLEPFEDELTAEFHAVYTRGDVGGAGEMELRREDLDLEVLDSNTLDLTGAAEEQILLALKPHPVCSEACRGLCPNCGGNRNHSACRCAEESIDPRFAALAALRAEEKG